MEEKKRFGIILIIAAVLFAGFSIFQTTQKQETGMVQETNTILQEEKNTMTAETERKTITENETETEIITETMDVYHDEHTDIKPVEVKYPDQDILNMVNSDKEGLFNQVQAFVNGYGYLDAVYAEYAGDVHYNSKDEIVKITYYLKFKRKDGIYFYLQYSKKNKMWKSFIA